MELVSWYHAVMRKSLDGRVLGSLDRCNFGLPPRRNVNEETRFSRVRQFPAWLGTGFDPVRRSRVAGFWQFRSSRTGTLIVGCRARLAAGFSVAELAAQDQGLVVRRLEFKGNRSVECGRARGGDPTTNRLVRPQSTASWLGLGEKRRLNERELRVDVARSRLLYQLERVHACPGRHLGRDPDRDGLPRSRSGSPRVSRSGSGASRSSGLDSFPDRPRLVRDLPLRSGCRTTAARLEATAIRYNTRLWNRGYPDRHRVAGRARPRYGRQNRRSRAGRRSPRPGGDRSDPDQGTRMSIHLRASLLATRPGREFRSTELYRSQLNLYRSGLFRFATVDSTPLGSRSVIRGAAHGQGAGGAPPPGPRGLGLGTNDCFRLGAGGPRGIAPGARSSTSGPISKVGRRDRSRWRAPELDLQRPRGGSIGSSKLNYGFTASFRRPAFLSPANALTVTLFAERRSEFEVYLREDVGDSGSPLPRGSRARGPVSLTYRLTYGSTQANASAFCAFFLACARNRHRPAAASGASSPPLTAARSAASESTTRSIRPGAPRASRRPSARRCRLHPVLRVHPVPGRRVLLPPVGSCWRCI